MADAKHPNKNLMEANTSKLEVSPEKRVAELNPSTPIPSIIDLFQFLDWKLINTFEKL